MRLTFFTTLLFLILTCAPAWTAAPERQPLSADEQTALQHLEQEARAGEVSAGTHSDMVHALATLLQATAIMLPFLLVALLVIKRNVVFDVLSRLRRPRGSDRRRFERIPVRTGAATVSLSLCDNLTGMARCLVQDISRGGIGIRLDECELPVASGQEVRLCLADPGNGPDGSFLNGTIRWMRGNALGIMFHEALDQDHRFLKHLFTAPGMSPAYTD